MDGSNRDANERLTVDCTTDGDIEGVELLGKAIYSGVQLRELFWLAVAAAE